MASTPPQFSSVLHILAERAEWNQLAQYLHTLQSSDDDSISQLLLTCEGPHAWTPLMLSCARAPPEIIQLLLASCPESVKTADRSGTYPLHFVCSWKAGVEEEQEEFELKKVLELLLEFGPEVMNMQNQWGQTPLHCIFDNEDLPTLETLKILLGIDSEEENFSLDHTEDNSSKLLKNFALKALATHDTNSYLPLHLAAAKGASEDILRLLVSIYPKAAITADTSGDLPIHLLQYHAEDTARENMDGPMVRQGSWRGGSGIFRLKKSKTFDVIDVGQVEALLEPLCLSQNQSKKRENNDDDTADRSCESLVDTSEAINSATRLPGSRNMNLPIHMAAEHGASFDILKDLCEQNPEGPATPQPICKSLLASSCSSLSAMEDRFKSPEIFPIESFQKGRAAIEATQAANNLMLDFEGSDDISIDKSILEVSKKRLKSFEDRNDLLFAFCPDAVPSIFRECKRNVKKSRKIPFREDPERLRRLEKLIRTEALDSSVDSFSLVARYVWLWLYRGINSSDVESNPQFQGSVGRIITGLPREALLKLSFISHIANDLGIPVDEDIDSLKGIPCLIQGKNIIQYAQARDPNMTMNAILVLNENEKRNFVHTLCEYLDAHSALAFSTTCRKTMRAGVRLFPEVKLKETGRSWKLSSRDELTESKQTEFWQHLDSKLMLLNSTHTVFVSYYLEVSQSSIRHFQNEDSSSVDMVGGLLVTSEDASYADKEEDTVETQLQKRLVHSSLVGLSGYEVQLSFVFKPGRSYSLRVQSSEKGGRISVSNARIRQVVYCLDRHKRTPLQVLLTSKPEYTHLPLSTQITTLIEDRYGFSDITSSLLLHYALKNRVSMDVMEALVASNPSLMLETDLTGRTPLHTIFTLSEGESPTLGTVKLLLRTPGENATKLKDRDYKVPLHIAAEMGVSNAILELLTAAYPDGCYRQTKDGNLPVHLLMRSGKATTTSIEMLLRPIMDSETICSIGGSQGLQLPLHIAAEYNCSYVVLERLLTAYGAAASIPRRRSESSDDEYTIDIFEKNRKDNRLCLSPAKSSKSFNSSRTLGDDSLQKLSNQAANLDLEEADFNLRSDLIFVHYPLTPGIHREDKNRIRRLRNLIKREATDCIEHKKHGQERQMSTMARLAWCFFCTYDNAEDLSDHYTDEVGCILKSLTIPAVKLLASVTNPFSSPPHMLLSACATEKCRHLISSRVLFVGRYVFEEDHFVLHKSHDTFVVKAKDYGATDEYKKLLSTFKQEEQLSDIDDLESVDGGSIVHALSYSDETSLRFIDFAIKIGLDEDVARLEFENLLSHSNGNVFEESCGSNIKGDLTLEAFRGFCTARNIDRQGVRNVVIKFMRNRVQFLREKVSRARLNLSSSDWYVLPVIEDYDIDRAENDDIESIDEIVPKSRCVLSDSKDTFFALDLTEMDSLGHDFSSFGYALVLPRGDKDFNDLIIHEELDIGTIRDLALKVAKAVNELHARGVVHGNLALPNIVKVGSDVAIIDLESATLSRNGEVGSILSNNIAGISQNFASTVLPPEMIARLDLSRDANDLKRYELHWEQIHNDALDMYIMKTYDVDAISSTLRSLHEQIQTSAPGALQTSTSIWSSLKPKVNNPEDSWREKISEALHDISIEDLPTSLSECRTLEDFRAVWMRVKRNHILWERIRPRISASGKEAYVAKYHNDLDNNRDRNLPYDIMPSSEKIDVWGFGILLFSLYTRSTLFHQTLFGDLQGSEAYEHLYGWDEAASNYAIKSSVSNPIAQDLLLKILTREGKRLPSMKEVLNHPFFGSWSSPAALNIAETYDRQTIFLEPCDDSSSSRDSSSSPPSDEVNNELSDSYKDLYTPPMRSTHTVHFDDFSMEKMLKIVSTRLEDILVPTSFIILPYKLVWNNARHIYEAPMDSRTIAKAEKVGKHLLKINTLTAKLYFWLRVKENLSESNGNEFKAKIMNWIQRARAEGSEIIAQEIVTSISCNESYEPICIEMLDEEMSISHARAFIRDPLKAAATLIHEEIVSLLECYDDQFMYLIDEHRGFPYMPSDSLSISFETDGIYPIALRQEEDEFKDFLLPFVNIAVMVATANDGLNGLSRLLGIFSPTVLEAWEECNIGLVHKKKSFGKSSIIEFATLQGILRKEFKGLLSDVHIPQSIQVPLVQDPSDNVTEIQSLEAFYQRQDPLGSFAGLHRIYDEMDDSLTFWTSVEDQKTIQNQREFANGLKRLDQLQSEIAEKKKLEEEFMLLNRKLLEIKKKTETRMQRRREKKVRVVSPHLKLSTREERPSQVPENKILPILEQSSTSSKSEDPSS